MYKKGEITVSSVVYAIMIGLALIMTMALMTSKLSSSYNVADVPEFEEFSGIYDDFNSTAKDLVDSQNYQDEDNVSKNWIIAVADNVQSYWEESLIRKGFQTIKIVPKMLGYAGKSVSVGLGQTGVYVPSPMRWLLITMIAVVIVFAVAKAYWQRKI